MRHISVPTLCALFLGVCFGCTSTKTSHTARTGREQLLISNAVDQSLNKVDFAPFRSQNVFFDTTHLDGVVDKSYIVGSVRHRLLYEGVQLVEKREDSDIVLEIRSGGVGTDSSDSFFGVSEIVLPGVVTLPEVQLVTRSRQTAVAKLGLVAYDTKTLRVLGDGGVSVARSDDNNWFILGAGPVRTGSVKDEMEVSTEGDATVSWSPRLPRRVAFQSFAHDGGVQHASAEEMLDESADE